MHAQIAQAIDDLKVARDEVREALFRNPDPDEDKPHWLYAHLFDEKGKPKERGVK